MLPCRNGEDQVNLQMLTVLVAAHAAPAADPLEEAQSLKEQTKALFGAGKFAEAEDAARRSLALREGALPKGHVDIADSLNNLALIVAGQGTSRPRSPSTIAAWRFARPHSVSITQKLQTASTILR